MLDSRDITKLHWKVRIKAEQLVKNCAIKGIKIQVISTVRDEEYQNKLYQQGRTTPGSIVTNVSKPTFHSDKVGLAFDVVPVVSGSAVWGDNNLWKVIGEEGVKLGLTWGGNWKSFVDKPHFQLDEGLKSSDIINGKRPSWFDTSEFEIEVEPKKETLSPWAIEAHKFVTENNISDGTRPKDLVTREEQFVITHRLYKVLGGK